MHSALTSINILLFSKKFSVHNSVIKKTCGFKYKLIFHFWELLCKARKLKDILHDISHYVLKRKNKFTEAAIDLKSSEDYVAHNRYIQIYPKTQIIHFECLKYISAGSEAYYMGGASLQIIIVYSALR